MSTRESVMDTLAQMMELSIGFEPDENLYDPATKFQVLAVDQKLTTIAAAFLAYLNDVDLTPRVEELEDKVNPLNMAKALNQQIAAQRSLAGVIAKR